MVSDKQLKVLEPFLGNVFREYSYRELREKTSEKSNNFLQLTIKRFKQEDLLKERKLGTSTLYSLNLKNRNTFSLLEILARSSLKKSASSTINILLEEIEKKTLFFSIVLFGSYASNSSKSDSDIDLMILVPDKSMENSLKIAINSASNKALITIDAHIITEEDFLKMLNADYSNLAKEIAMKNKPIYNAAIFYKTVQRGIDNGFKIIP